MGRRTKHIIIEHLNTNVNIKQFKGCSQCPMKLYCDNDDTILYGIGNRFSNTMFVLPTYDAKATIGYTTIFTELSNVYKSITDNEITEKGYVTRLVKCYTRINKELANSCIKHCVIHLYNEINSINPKKVIFFGNTLNMYLSSISNNIANRQVYSIYNPAVMFYDNKYKEEFINQLKQAIYD